MCLLLQFLEDLSDRELERFINAVYLHRLGYNFDKIVELLCVAKSSAMAYVEEFENQNKSENFLRGGTKQNLSEEQKKDLIAHLEDKTYLKCDPIIAFINDTYDKFLIPKAASRNFCIAIGSSIKKTNQSSYQIRP